MFFSKSLILAALCTIVADAHICMWSPVQRNGFAIGTPGESLCYLKEGPCGGVASSEPQTNLIAGQTFSVLFQQNLNHFYIENPGKLVVDFASSANPLEEDFTPLGAPVADYNAMNEITQTNFTVKVVIPNVQTEHGVVRLRYISQNPTENDRGMTFFQCADVRITKGSEEKAATKTAVAPVAAAAMDGNGTDCCAPKQFTLEGYETASWRNPTAKKYYFDAVNRLFRVDTNSGSGTDTKDGYFQMFNNFTSGIEYYFNVNAGTCDLYGLNLWADWCYGGVNKQSFLQSVTVGTQTADVWKQEGTPFSWTSTRHSCVPVSQVRDDTGEATFFYNMRSGAPDASVFALPAACVRSEEVMLAAGGMKTLAKAPAHHEKV